MESKSLVVSLNGGADRVFRNWESVDQFLVAVEGAWKWLQPAASTAGFPNVWQHYWNNFAALRQAARNQQSQGGRVESFDQLRNAFSIGGPLFDPSSEQGGAISSANKVGGPRAGAFAYGVLTGTLNFGQGSTRADAIGLLLAAFPNWGLALEAESKLAAERKAYKSALNRHLSDLEQDREANAKEWRDRVGLMLVRSRRLVRKRIRAWNDQQARRDEVAAAAVDSLKNTEDAYTEFMHLQAPVQYWKDEATRHKTAKEEAIGRLKVFFPSAAATFLVGFIVSGYILTNASKQGAAALHFLIAAALVSIATLTFWIGRIFTKLYLSEHHLEQDAQQRAVMTTTYLALLNEGGATADADRSAILAALFRSTPDGIVKEDGPSDIASLAGLLSKLGVR